MEWLDPNSETWHWINNALTPFYYSALVVYAAVVAFGVLGALGVS